MTLVGLEFLKHQETKRHNLASEQLTLAGYENDRFINAAKISSSEKIASQDRLSREGIASLDRGSRESIASLDRQSREDIASLDRQSREYIASEDRKSKESIATSDRQSREDIAGKDRDSREKLTKWQIGGNVLTTTISTLGHVIPWSTLFKKIQGTDGSNGGGAPPSGGDKPPTNPNSFPVVGTAGGDSDKTGSGSNPKIIQFDRKHGKNKDVAASVAGSVVAAGAGTAALGMLTGGGAGLMKMWDDNRINNFGGII